MSEFNARIKLSYFAEASCFEAFAKWGLCAQAFQCMGECGELIAEINRFFNQGREESKDKIIEEMGDVFVLLFQLREAFGSDVVDDAISNSFEKLRKKLDKQLEQQDIQEVKQ